MNRVRLQTQYDSYQYGHGRYAENPIQNNADIIDGYFRKESTEKEMAIKKVNKTLSTILMSLILIALGGYYFAMSSELTLNTLSRQITTLNDENAELQRNLDRLKSFNNVDMKIAKSNVLQKAEKVLEVDAVVDDIANVTSNNISKSFDWAVGY
ncbi:MAG: hypothetical protein R3Y28_01885 [Candidatus Gastranaerophilales bacterium]